MSNNETVREVYVADEFRSDIKPSGFATTRVIGLKFPRPCKVRGVDGRSVEVEVPVIAGQPPFSQEFCKQVVEVMGEVGADSYLDDMADYLMRQFIIRNIR